MVRKSKLDNHTHRYWLARHTMKLHKFFISCRHHTQRKHGALKGVARRKHTCLQSHRGIMMVQHYDLIFIPTASSGKRNALPSWRESKDPRAADFNYSASCLRWMEVEFISCIETHGPLISFGKSLTFATGHTVYYPSKATRRAFSRVAIKVMHCQGRCSPEERYVSAC